MKPSASGKDTACQRLKKIRTINNLEIQSMSKMLRLTKPNYLSLEEGTAMLTVEHLKALFEHLKVSANYLLFGKGPIYVETASIQAPEIRMELNRLKRHMEEIRALLNN